MYHNFVDFFLNVGLLLVERKFIKLLRKNSIRRISIVS